MGTEITLKVGGLDLDWSKNSRGTDHGMLFQERDRKRIHCDQIDYDYFNQNNEDPGPMEMGFCKPLREVIPRLELLGFTLDKVWREYVSCAETWCEERQVIAGSDEELALDLMNFTEFCAFVTAHPLQSLDDTFISSIDPGSETVIRGRFGDETVTRRLPCFSPYESYAYSERSYFASLIGILHPYSVLRVLAENKVNLDADVVWQYGPLVENGWADESEFTPCSRRTQTFLVVTEGTSDAYILKHAFSLLRPEIADFFKFIDVSERHPFPGAGNLLKFAEGLAKIDVHHQVIFLFDNDAEGFDIYQRLLRLELPINMRAMMLPELEQFRSFQAQGPEGVARADINRRAAAIECYLDLEIGGYPPAKVVWTNYKKELAVYHGALEFK
ncbi:MAG: HEPN/Toprim-associated domain-containing protein [Methylobacter sp.]|nr:HEPN/Toprim-associated domain-containing protein [Methylobacter sp.]